MPRREAAAAARRRQGRRRWRAHRRLITRYGRTPFRAAFCRKNESRFRAERRDCMLTKNDFSASDWKTLRDAQYLAGLATLMADSSGFGTIKESMALAQSIMENQASNFPFIRDLTSKAEMTAAQSGLKQRLEDPEARPTKEGVRRLTLDEVEEACSILKGKASAEEYGRLPQVDLRRGGEGSECRLRGRLPRFWRNPGEFRRAGFPGRAAQHPSVGAGEEGLTLISPGRCPAARCRRPVWRLRESRGAPGRRKPGQRGRPASISRPPSCAARLRSST